MIWKLNIIDHETAWRKLKIQADILLIFAYWMYNNAK